MEPTFVKGSVICDGTEVVREQIPLVVRIRESIEEAGVLVASEIELTTFVSVVLRSSSGLVVVGRVA